jgi:hypothetical protein
VFLGVCPEGRFTLDHYLGIGPGFFVRRRRESSLKTAGRSKNIFL